MALFSSPMKSQKVIELMPGPIDGWSPRTEDVIYTPETLFDYINGGAELYLSYDMKEVSSRIIVNGSNEIRIEIFDMTEARNAFGVFTHTRTKDEHVFGQGSQKFTGALIFWKGRFFVTLTANDENELINKTLESIAKEIDKKITETGHLPGIVQLLPEEQLEPDGFIYFHHYIWLNSYYFIASDNILNISPDTDCILAKYGNKEERSFLLLIEYHDSLSAAANIETFRNVFFDKGNINGFQIMEDGKWVAVSGKDQYLIGVFSASDKEYASFLIAETITNITKP